MKTRDIFMYVLGGLVVLCFFALLTALIFHLVPEGNVSTLNIAIGSLLQAFALVIGYFFGSSKGSADKTEMLVKMNDNGQNQ